MIFRSVLVILATCLALGCSESEKAKDPGAQPPPQTPDEKAKRLKEMPLEQALKTKYSRLQFVCDYGLTVTRPSGDGGSGSYSSSEQLLIWDLLEDYTKVRWFDFDYDFENVETNFQFKMTLSLEDLTSIKRDKDGREVAVKLVNAITASGEVQMRIVEKSLDGKTTELVIGRGPEGKVFNDRLPKDLIVTSFGPKNDPRRHTSIDVECSLDADVYPGYEGDYQEIN